MSRILNRQRKRTEQGRLRFGVYTGSRPKAITNWIVTSYSEEHVRTAAELWGGDVERWQPQGNGAQQWRVITNAEKIPAILPTGDPLNQAYELWTRGGCQRRCDGVFEKLSGSPCLCRAEFGEDFHEQKAGTVCGEKTRLSVYLPDMPGLGVWRMETGSYWATDEIATKLEDIRGAVGDDVLVPLTLHLQQRTVIRKGETKQYVVPIMDLQGATFGQLLAGSVTRSRAVQSAERAAVAQPERTAIEAPAQERPTGPVDRAAQEIAQVEACQTLEALTATLQQALQGYQVPNITGLPEPLQAAFAKARELLTNARPNSQGGCHCDVHDGVHSACNPGCPCADGPAPTASADELWAQIVAAWPGDRTDEIEQALTKHYGVPLAEADGEQLAQFLADIQAGHIKPAASDDTPPF